MSSGTRTTAKGGKGAKTEKSHKNDKGDIGKGNGDNKHINRDTNSKFDDSVKEKVKLLVEMSQKPEDEVCMALHECDYDVNQTMNMLLENESGVMGEWETRVKKKKNRQASSGKDKGDESGGTDDWNDLNSAGGGGGGGLSNDKDKRRDKSGGPARLHGRHNDGRGWRGREKQENDRNLEDGGRGDGGRERRSGRGGGPSSRGGGGARGRGGGRAGGRFPPRGNRSGTFSKPIETWDNSNTWDNSTATAGGGDHNTEETWEEFHGTDEWTTEEYTGDTKVFTPSVLPVLDSIPDGSGAQQPPVDPTTTAGTAPQQQLAAGLQLPGGPNILPTQSPVPPIVGSLNAAQTQYLSQLTQQNSDALNKQFSAAAQTYQGQTYEKNPSQGYNSAAAAAATPQQQSQPSYATQQQYQPTANYVNSNYAPVNNYAGAAQDQQQPQQPVRTKTQRARVPPPSKIPSSAVEMPGDIAYLDVQFGGMDFMDNNSFDGVNDHKYTNANSLDNSTATPSVNLDLNSANQNSTLDSFSPKTQNQSSISSALSQSLSNTDNIPQTSEHLPSSYNTAPRNTQGAGTASSATAGIDLNKQSDSHSYSQPSSYNSYQSKTNSYNSSTYSGTQTTSSSYVSNQSNNYVNNQSATYNNPSGGNSYPSYSSSASYQSNNTNATAFPSSTNAANSYPSSNQTYPQNTSQSVYAAANAGLNNSSNYGSNTSTSQYNSYSSASSHKLGKDNSYDASSVVSSTQSTTTNVTSSSTALSLSQTTVSSSKTTTTLAAKNSSSSVVSNIPPGVTPVMSTQYIMGQVPYFQQPVYSFEEMQMLQQRLPHMTPTTLPTVRDAAIGNVGGYSLSDGRFTRGDNNASPVPSTLSQQTSTLTPGHQAQPILTGGAPPYFFAPTAFNTIATNYQFGTMYTQLPAGTNAHGSSNSNQYPKPGTYGSGYGAYDTLSQTPDYNKGSYVTNAQGQKGAGGSGSSTGSAGNDLSGMYGKSHTALGKVNSYEKQGFHSGTPPPFTGALHGSQNAGLAPSGTGYGPQVYIPTMGPHQQHHSTQLMHQPHLQDSGNSSGQRSQASNQAKAGSKQSYPTSYWNPA